MAMAMTMTVPMAKPRIPSSPQLTHFSRTNSSPFPSVCPLAQKWIHYNRKNGSISSVASASQENANNERLELTFVVGTQLIPHPDKAEKGGEDALFVSSCNGSVLAVADGVSGWAEKNVDPAVFPKELMANISYSIGDDEVNNDPRFLLQKAHAKTCSIGSATVIVAMLEKHGTLKIANVGDCGLRILRKGRAIFSTSPQEHYFDCPFQLSSEIAGQTYKDAMVYSTDIMEGDIVIMGSDGLFDNVFDHEIESVVSRFEGSQREVVKKAAEALADLASTHARDRAFESPYCLEARIQGYDIPMWKKLLGMKFAGGKLDDITVIVGMVVKAPVLPESNSHLDVVKDIPNLFSEIFEAESSLGDKSLTYEVQPRLESLLQTSANNQSYGIYLHKELMEVLACSCNCISIDYHANVSFLQKIKKKNFSALGLARCSKKAPQSGVFC